jgi:hypothetical protein
MAEFLPPFFILRYLLTVIFPPIIEAALYTVEKVQLYRPFPPVAAEENIETALSKSQKLCS